MANNTANTKVVSKGYIYYPHPTNTYQVAPNGWGATQLGHRWRMYCGANRKHTVGCLVIGGNLWAKG